MNKNKKIKAVIFDLDGVIIDSEPLGDIHNQQYLKKLGIEVELTYFQKFRGANSKTYWTIVKEEFRIEQDISELIKHGRQSFNDFLDSLPDLVSVPGVIELLKKLKKENYKIALASSANPERIKKIINRLGLTDMFDVILSGDDTTHGKPHPEIFQKAAKLLKMLPSECLVIEDSENGIKAARAAGMKVLGFAGLPNNKQSLTSADLIIYSFNEISSDIIQSL